MIKLLQIFCFVGILFSLVGFAFTTPTIIFEDHTKENFKAYENVRQVVYGGRQGEEISLPRKDLEGLVAFAEKESISNDKSRLHHFLTAAVLFLVSILSLLRTSKFTTDDKRDDLL